MISKVIGGKGGMGPAWTRGEIERPLGEENMGTWTEARYTAEQMARLNVDKYGKAVEAKKAAPKAQATASPDAKKEKPAQKGKKEATAIKVEPAQTDKTTKPEKKKFTAEEKAAHKAE
jgi:hypothetical protein